MLSAHTVPTCLLTFSTCYLLILLAKSNENRPINHYLYNKSGCSYKMALDMNIYQYWSCHRFWSINHTEALVAWRYDENVTSLKYTANELCCLSQVIVIIGMLDNYSIKSLYLQIKIDIVDNTTCIPWTYNMPSIMFIGCMCMQDH